MKNMLQDFIATGSRRRLKSLCIFELNVYLDLIQCREVVMNVDEHLSLRAVACVACLPYWRINVLINYA